MCLGGGAKSSCQRVLWIDGSASYGHMGLQSPSLISSAKSLSVVPQNTGGWTQDGSFSLLGMDYGLAWWSSTFETHQGQSR